MRRLLAQMSIASLVLVGATSCTGKVWTSSPESTEVVTPHIAWARPYAYGPVKALFIIRYQSQREVLELAERLSLDATVVTETDMTYYGKTPTWGDENINQLRVALQGTYDVMVLGQIQWASLPADCQQGILDKLAGGTGLAGTLSDSADVVDALFSGSSWQSISSPVSSWLTSAVPFKALPAFSSAQDAETFAKSFLRLGTLGPGRVALLTYPTIPISQALTPGRSADLRSTRLDYDYYLAFVIKALLWAAQHEPPIVVQTSGPQLTVARDSLATQPVEWTIAGGSPKAALEYAYTVRDHVNHIWHTSSGGIPGWSGDATRLSPELPPLPAGAYFADLFVMTSSSVVSFGSVALNVTSPSHLGTISLTKAAFSRSEPITGVVNIVNPAADLRVSVKAFDNLDRQIGVTEGSASASTLSFSVSTIPALAILGRIEAELVSQNQGGAVLDRAEIGYSLNDYYPDSQDLREVLWASGSYGDFITPLAMNEFRKRGLDTQYGGFSKDVPAENLWHLPYLIRFVDAKTDWYLPAPTRQEGDYVRDPVLTDPAYLEQVRQTLTTKVNQVLPYSTREFSLGDEDMFQNGEWDLSISPTDNADFRVYLQDQYGGSLDNVNAEWGTAFSSWDAVVPITLKDAQASGAYYPQWVDHRLHMESVWASIFQFSHDVIRNLAPPGARVGYEGSDSVVGSFHADDYWKLSKTMNLNNIYYRDFLTNVTRDFYQPGSLLGLGWYGAYKEQKSEPYMRWMPWREVFKGANSLWIFAGFAPNDFNESVMAPTLKYQPYFQASNADLAELKAGTGKLLVSSERQHDGIAVLWSPSSVHAERFTRTTFPGMNSEYESLALLIHDMGLEFRTVSYEQLALGQVTPEEFKVLMLPFAQALSQKEIDAISAFEQAGGTVIADLRPGIYDEHGKLYSTRATDAMFGVTQSASAAMQWSYYWSHTITVNDSPVEMLLNMPTDTSVAVTTGTPGGKIGTSPILITRKSGKGGTVLLNFSSADYVNEKSRKTSADGSSDFADWAFGVSHRQLIRDVFQSAGVTSPVTLSPEQPDVEISRFKNGSAEYVGVLQRLPQPAARYVDGTASIPKGVPVTLRLLVPAHVYDVRSGTYLGLTDGIQVTLIAGAAQLYALMPYRLGSMSFTIPSSVSRGAVAAYSVTLGQSNPAPHVLRVEVRDPADALRGEYAANMLTAQGKGDGELPIAFSDPVGQWSIVARDVATGARATASFRVQ